MTPRSRAERAEDDASLTFPDFSRSDLNSAVFGADVFIFFCSVGSKKKELNSGPLTSERYQTPLISL